MGHPPPPPPTQTTAGAGAGDRQQSSGNHRRNGSQRGDEPQRVMTSVPDNFRPISLLSRFFTALKIIKSRVLYSNLILKATIKFV